MKVTVKTDKFIELLNGVIFRLYPMFYKVDCSDELLEIIKNSDDKGKSIQRYYTEKTGKNIFETDEDALNSIFNKDRVFRRLTEMKALMFYRLCPMMILKVDIQDKNEALNVLNKLNVWTGEPFFDEVWDVLQCEMITIEDLKNEFWEICPDVDSIHKYLQITRVKFKKLLENIPDREYYSLDALLFNKGNNVCANDVRKLQEAGLLTKKEAEDILMSIHQIVDNINSAIDRIVEMYNELKAMATIHENTGNIDNSIAPQLENEELRRLFWADAIPSFLEIEAKLITDNYINATLKWVQQRKKKDLAEFIVVLKEHGYFKKRGINNKELTYKDYRCFFEQRYKVDISKQMQPANRPNGGKTFILYPIVKQQ